MVKTTNPFLSIVRSVFILFALLSSASCAPHPRPEIAVNACFSPRSRCLAAITAGIEKATVEVLIQASSLTSRPIADALIKAKDQGLRVAVVLDRPPAQNSVAPYIVSKGIPTYIDAKHTVAHDDIVVLDRETVMTGGFAFTNESEEKTAEDLVIIRSGDVAETYMENWRQHRIHSEEFKPGATPKGEPRKKEKKKKNR